jgi:type IV pilus assembly protein PilB
MGTEEPMGSTTAQDEVKILNSSFLFRDIPDHILQEIARRLVHVRYQKSQPIFLEHERSDRVYFIAQGSVEVIKYMPHSSHMQRVVTFQTGDCFSEFSLVTRSQHTTSALALEDCEIFELDQASFLALMHQFPQIGLNLVRNLAQLNQQVLREKNQIDTYREGLLDLTAQLPQLLPYSFIDQYQVLPVRYQPGYLLVAMRDPHHPTFYKAFRALHPEIILKMCLISEKDFQLLRRSVNPLYKAAGLNPSLTPHTASAGGHPGLPPKPFLREAFAETAALLQGCPSRRLKAGDWLYEAGEPNHQLLIVLHGDFELRVPEPDGRTRYVSHSGRGELLGEVSFLSETAHTVSAQARLDSEVLEISREMFTLLARDPHFIMELAQRLAKRLQRSNQLVRLQGHAPSVTHAPSGKLASLLPHHILQHHRIVPLDLVGNHLTLGVVSHDNDQIFSLLHRYIGQLNVEIVLIHESVYQSTLKNLIKDPAAADFGKVSVEGLASGNPQRDIASDLDLLLATAIRLRASDIHMEMQESGMTFRLRIDGQLQELEERVSVQSGKHLLNRIKVLCKLDLGECRLPQDGHLSLTHLQNSSCPNARVSLVPTVHGEKAVIRLHKTHAALLPLELLTPDRSMIMQLREAIDAREGLCLVVGPTGCGKTSTLYAMLKTLNRVDSHVVSVEDPVEAVIPGVTQIPIQEDIGRTFETTLRHLLRQDPNVLMIGEMRDHVSAQMAFEAAMTGHLVLTTLHAIDVATAIPRLHDLGIQPAMLKSALRAIISQRLLRAICPECRLEVPTSPHEKEQFRRFAPHIPAPETVCVGQGCVHCHYSGYFDRLAVYEIWQPSTAPGDGTYQTLLQSGFRLAAQGLTTLDEVLRICPRPFAAPSISP